MRNKGAENVRHEFYTVQAKDRYAALKRIADVNPNIYGIVFCRTRKITRDIAAQLIADGYNTDSLHGELSQAQRDHVMNRFRHKQIQLLIATDVAARGLDVDDLTHIINYDLPDDNEVYIHRTGRTARAGKSGVAISIIHSREQKKIRDIEKMTGKKFTAKKVPTGVEVCEKQLFNLVDRVENVEVNQEQIEQFLPVINKKLSWLSREELIKHFVSVEFNRFLSYYKDSTDLNITHEEKRKASSGRGGKKFVKMNINLGRKQDLDASFLINIINEQTRRKNIAIGKIEIFSKSATFEVEESNVKDIFRAFKNTNFEGMPVHVKKDEPKFSSRKPRKK